MAIKLTGPAENSVLIDANITEIILSHTDAQEHYHYAKFYIDNVLFDELVIPRISESKIVLQFSNLLLKTLVFPAIQNNVTIQSYRLDRILRIEVYKNKNNVNNLVNTFNYLLRYATKATNERFNAYNVTFINVDAQAFVIGEEFRLLLPFYHSNSANFNVTLIGDEGHSYMNQNFSFNVAEKTFLLNKNINVLPTTNFLELRITHGNSYAVKHFKVLRNTLYSGKSVMFLNKFGYPLEIQLFGKLSTKDDFAVTTYENGLGALKTAEVKEETTFTVDTGYLTEKERGIVSQIVNSLETKIKIGNVFVECVPTVKSITTYTDGEYVTQNQLSFKINKNPKIKN
nr:hypothetical protein [uncultured Flavobacterium sp.]